MILSDKIDSEEMILMIRVNKIKDNIYQIKVIDDETRSFHGCIFPVLDGASYNCYLVLDEQVTLIDTVDDVFFAEVFVEIKKILNGKNIDNVIINHVEPDHSGSFALIMKEFPNAKAYTSKAGIKAMHNQFFKDYEYHVVGTNDSLNIGKYDLLFFETPLVHWPDNMWTYLKEEEILFSNDAFGQLLIDDVLYDEEITLDKLLAYSKEYYANIVWPNNKSVKATLAKFIALDWKIKIIAPAHGIVLKKYINQMIEQYTEFTENKTEKKAVVIYESIWSNTKIMANLITDELKELGFEVKEYQISKSRISEIITELTDAELLILGTGNHNNCLLPPIADFLERLKASRFEGRKAIVFGSYGWSPAPFNDLKNRLIDAKFEVLGEPIINNYTPSNEAKVNIAEKVDELLK